MRAAGVTTIRSAAIAPCATSCASSCSIATAGTICRRTPRPSVKGCGAGAPTCAEAGSIPAGDAEIVPLPGDSAACENLPFGRSESHNAGEDSQFCRAQNSWVDHNTGPLSLRESAEPCDKQPLMRHGRPPSVEGYLAAIVDSSDDAIISKGLDGVITSWNRAAVRLFGYSQDEAIGRSVHIIVPPDRAAEEQELVARVRVGGIVDAFETVRQAKDGTPIDVSVVLSAIRDSSGAVVGVSTIARDIRERARADFATRRLAAIIM